MRLSNTLPLALWGMAVLYTAVPMQYAWAGSEYGDPSVFDLLDGLGGFNGGDTRTRAQYDRQREITQAQEGKAESIKQKMEAISRQVSTMLSEEATIDTATLSSLEEQRAALQEQRDAVDIDMLVQIRALLTPAQLAEAAQRHRQLTELSTKETTLRGEPLDYVQYRPISWAVDAAHLLDGELDFSRSIAITRDQGIDIAKLHLHHLITAREPLEKIETIRQQIADRLGGTAALTTQDLRPLQRQLSALKNQLEALRLDLVLKARAALTSTQLREAVSLHRQLSQLGNEKQASRDQAQAAK